MPDFSIHATYATRTGRQGSRDMLRTAPDIEDAMRQARKLLERQGNTKIDLRAWPVNQWKDEHV